MQPLFVLCLTATFAAVICPRLARAEDTPLPWVPDHTMAEQAAEPFGPPDDDTGIDGLARVVAFPLTRARNGIDGRIELWEDARTPDYRRAQKLAGIDNICDERPRAPQVAKICESITDRELRRGRLRVMDSRAHEVEARELLYDARLTKTHLYGDARVAYALGVDESAGFGSYSGWMTRFLEVTEGTLRFVTAVDVTDGQEWVMTFMDSLKTEWREVPRKSRSGRDFLVAMCRPDWETNDGFRLHFLRYSFAEGRFRIYERTELGFWEADQPFPDRSKFP